MKNNIPENWLSTLKRDDDLLIGYLTLPFLQQSQSIEVSFVNVNTEPSEVQLNTLHVYMEKLESIHKEVIRYIFQEYQSTVQVYRAFFNELGEDANANAPIITASDQLSSLLLYQSFFIPEIEKSGLFGMGFWAKWEQEHGIGVRFESWKISEIGECSIHFQF